MAGRAYSDWIWSDVPEAAVPAGFARRRAFLLSHVSPGDSVLDFGCGAGEFAAALAGAGARVIGADVSREALRRATVRHPDLDLRPVAEGAPLPLDDAQFDVVWAGDVIEHVVDTPAALSELRRVLRPGGRLILTTPYHGRLATIVLALRPCAFERHFDPRSDHVRFYTAAGLRALLTDFRFTDIAIRPAGGSPALRQSLHAVATRARW